MAQVVGGTPRDARPLAQVAHDLGDGLGCGRPLGPEDVDAPALQPGEQPQGQRGQGDGPLPRLALGRAQVPAAVALPGDGPPHREGARRWVNVAPLERCRLTRPEPRHEHEGQHRGEGAPVLQGCGEEGPHLRQAPVLGLPGPMGGPGHPGAGVAGQEPHLHRPAQAGPQGGVGHLHRPAAHAPLL